MTTMKKGILENRRISADDRDRIVNEVEAMAEIGIRDMAAEIATALKMKAVTQDPQLYNLIDLGDDAFREHLLFDLLHVIADVEAKNDGILYFPDIDELTPQEKVHLASSRARNRASELKERNNKTFRQNVKKMYDAAVSDSTDISDIERDLFAKTFEAIDADLEADILLIESLQTTS